MLCRSGLAMSPMKNPKLSVAASRTKKPKMTFSRFTRLLSPSNGPGHRPGWTNCLTPGRRGRALHVEDQDAVGRTADRVRDHPVPRVGQVRVPGRRALEGDDEPVVVAVLQALG